MNKTYKTIYNERTQTWVAVSETTKAKGKKSSAARHCVEAVFFMSVLGGAVAAEANTNYTAGNSVLEAAGTNKQSVGVGSKISVGEQATALGNDVNATGKGSVGIGGDDIGDSNLAGYVFDSTFQHQSGNLWYRTLTATGAGAVALGSQTYATGLSSSALGARATATGDYAAAVTPYATATGNFGIALGALSRAGTVASHERTIAIGHNAKAESTDTVALGSSTVAKQKDGIAIGRQASSHTARAIALGSVASAGGNRAIAIGGEDETITQQYDGSWRGTPTNAAADNSIAMGAGARTVNTAKGGIAIGSRAHKEDGSEITGIENAGAAVYAINGIALGSGAIAGKYGSTDFRSIAIGSGANVAGKQSVGVGPGLVVGAGSENSSAFGYSAAIGRPNVNDLTGGNFRNVNQATALGANAQVMAGSNWGTAVGSQAQVRQNSPDATAVGANAVVMESSAKSVALGVLAKVNANAGSAVAIGDSSQVSAEAALAIGKGAKASAKDAIAIGSAAQATGLSSISIGMGNRVSGANSGAIGDPNSIGGTGSYALGNNNNLAGNGAFAVGSTNTVNSDDTFVLGSNVEAVIDNSVYLGKGSTATSAASGQSAGTTSYKENTNQTIGYVYTAGTPAGVVSIGAVGAERRLQNVSAGLVAADSTDAINGSQLYATQQVIGRLASSTAQALGGASEIKSDGTISAPHYKIQPNATTAATEANAATTVGEALERHENRLVSVEGTVNQGITFNAGKDTASSGSLTKKLGQTLGIKGSGNLSSKVLGDDVLIEIVNNPTFTGTVKAKGFDADGSKITKVAAGDLSAASTDAVNGAQLFAVKNTADSAQATADSANTTASDALNKATKNEGNINKLTGEMDKGLVFAAENASEKVALGDTIKVAGDGKNISTAINNKSISVTLSDTPSFTSVSTGSVVMSTEGINLGAKKLSNVAAGVVSASSTDGINGSQLHALAQNLSDYLGGGASVASGKVSRPTYNVGGVSYHSVGDALAATNRQAGTVVFVDSAGNRVYRASDGKFYNRLDSNGGGEGAEINVDMLHHALLDPNGSVTAANALSNVGKGKLDTDAANVSQLKGVITALGGGAAVNADGSIKAPSYNIKPDAHTAVTPSNVATTVGDALGRHETRLVTVEDDFAVFKNKKINFNADENADLLVGLGESVDIKGAADKNVITKVAGRAIEIRLADNPTFTGKVSAVGFAAGGAKITGVADGTDDHDALNVGQLRAFKEASEKEHAFVVKYDAHADGSINKDSITLAGGTNGSKITNLAEGAISATSKDAVSGAQLYKTQAALTDKGFALQAGDNNTVSKKLGETVRVLGDGNIITTATGDAITVALSSSPTIGTLKLNPDNSGKISGLAAGTASSEAVNYSQLKPLADALGAPIDTTTGAVSAPTYVVAGTNTHTVGDALNAVSTELAKGLKLSANTDAVNHTLPLGGTLNLSQGSNTTVALSGNKYTIGMVNNPTFTGMLTAAGGLSAGGNKITNVAAGTVASDAVNYQQLQDVITSVINTNKTNITLSSPMAYVTKNTDGSNVVVARAKNGKFYNVNEVDVDGNPVSGATEIATPIHISAMHGGGSSTTPITLSNIAAGVADSDAVNKKQLRDVVSIFGNGADMAADGSIVKPTYRLMGETYQSVGEVFNALNHGLAGTVVYTDDTGQRLAKVGGKFYKESEVNNNGELIGTPSAIDNTKVRLAAVDTAGSVHNGGIILGNIKAGVADNDAVNVKQLKNMGLDITGGKPVVTYDGTTRNKVTLGDVTTNPYNPDAGTGGVTLSNLARGTNPSDAVNLHQLSEVKKTADLAAQGWKLTANSESGDGASILPNGTLNVVQGQNISVTRKEATLTIATSDSPQFGTVKINDGSSNAVTGLSNKTFNTNTIVSGQGATEDQLKTVFDTLDMNIKSTTANSVNYDGADKGRVTLQGSGGSVITNLKKGSVHSTSLEAINGSQLYDSINSVAKRLGGGTTVDADGKLTMPSYAVREHTYDNIGDAISALGRQTAVVSYVNAAGEAVLRANDGKFYKKLAADGSGDSSSGDTGIEATAVHHALINADGSTVGRGSVLSNIGAGKISAGSTDAINGGQLYGSMADLTTLLGGGAAVNPDGTAKAPTYVIGAPGKTVEHNNVGAALSALNTQAFSPISLHGDKGTGRKVALGDSLRIIGEADGNITTTVTESGVLINTVATPKFGSITVNQGGTGKISGLADGEAETDAVNKKQLDAVSAALGDTDALAKKIVSISGDSGASTPTTFNLKDKPRFSIEGGAVAGSQASAGNILTETSADGVLIKMVDSPIFKGSLRAANADIGGMRLDGTKGHLTGLQNTTFDADAITSGRAATEDQLKALSASMKDHVAESGKHHVAYDSDALRDKVTFGGLKTDGTPVVSAGVTLANVKAGTAEKDAVNFGQLNAVRSNLATILGTSVDGTGKVEAPAYVVGGHTYANVRDAFAATNRQAGTVAYANADGVRVYKATDGKFYRHLNADGSGDVSAGDAGIDVATNPRAIHHALINTDGTTSGASGSVLSNVGVGKIAANSTEAINGAQLYAGMTVVSKFLGGGAGVNPDGSLKAPSYSIGAAGSSTEYRNVGDALSALNTQAFTPISVKADRGYYAVALGKELPIQGDGLNLSTIANAQGVSIVLSDTPKFGEITINDAGKISGVANGELPQDAVNKAQLDAVVSKAGADSSFAVKYDADSRDPSKPNTSKITLAGAQGTTLSNLKAGQVSGTSTEAVTGAQLHTTRVALADALGGGAMVDATGNVTAPNYTIGGVNHTNVGGALSNLDGRVSGNTGAISAIHQSINDGIFSVSANGEVSEKIGKGAVIDFASGADKNVVIARQGSRFGFSLADKVTLKDSLSVGNTVVGKDSVKVGDTIINKDHIMIGGHRVLTEGSINGIGKVKNAVQYDSDTHDKVTLGGVGSTTPVTLTNIKAGQLSATSSDAVNGSQLHATNKRVSTVEGKVSVIETTVAGLSDNALSYDAKDKNHVTLKGDAAKTQQVDGIVVVQSGGTAIHNLANGVDAADAVNKGQLDSALSDAKKYTDGEMNKLTGGFTGDLKAVKSDINKLKDGQLGMIRINNKGTTIVAPDSSGDNAVAVGSAAVASGKNSLALGTAAQATKENSVALGNGSIADRENTVSVGKQGAERQITHVAAGTRDTDAVNVQQMKEVVGNIGYSLNQLNRNINEVDRNARAGIAGVAAMANIPQVMKPGQKSFGLGTATYRGETAVSMGVSMSSDNGKWIFKGSASFDSRKRSVVGAGVSYIWE